MLQLPRLYCIIDAACFDSRGPHPSRSSKGGDASISKEVLNFARDLLASGATLIQYRNKQGSDRKILRHARELRRLTEFGQRPRAKGQRLLLIMNDRPDLALAAAFDGVHVGDQLRAAAQTDCDYLAIGPVFATASKQNPDPVIGLDGVRAARALLNQLPESARKPLVAIGGITRANCASVISAGADSVAVISDLLGSPQRAVREFVARLG